MSEKKIVSIEDRIPKLKQARKKKANRRLVFYLSIFFFLISIIVYLQSPLSHVKTINVKGNSYFTDESIIEQSNVSINTSIWSVNKEEVILALKGNPIIDSVDVQRKLPWTVDIHVSEHQRIGYMKDENLYFPILSNGAVLTEHGQELHNGDAPLLVGFTEEEYLHKLAQELSELPDSILNLISEVHWSPTTENKHKIMLYMNDGFLVDGTIRDFSNKMKVYPSIVSQLDPDEMGIIHIGVGAYFESFNQVTEEAEFDEVPSEEIDNENNEETEEEIENELDEE
ncbi:FtsQ-type POTRA domain-containing protein [Ornithinibacillus sp. L9]|uniref:Cell division protein DivIB n=1 Tax=Ornithinibacillus caprae TaxID=2678566 RepID=A0A6N8FP02_9BACI|nr:FtsQ-type POTRA domain-containing protein [Ornithinibacillus caprae]MUK89529.1 FtsQ-type POTRA domain-containing protein [Ornithinibacillus caprae]